jgi:hypothetical protein
MRKRSDFGNSLEDRGLKWYEHSMFFPSRYLTRLSISFGDIATHNHFVIDRGGKVFNRTAPVIKLPAGTSEDEHLGLMGLLNSSVACFWLKQVCFPKGGDHVGQQGARVRRSLWDERYAFNATNVVDLPLVESKPLDLAQTLDRLAQDHAAGLPATLIGSGATAGDGYAMRTLRDPQTNGSADLAQTLDCLAQDHAAGLPAALIASAMSDSGGTAPTVPPDPHPLDPESEH